jgi:hypothetical protein
MLVIELVAMSATSMFLVLLMPMRVMLVTLGVLEWLAQVHLHICPMGASAVHHDIVALVRVVLIEHSELLRRLWPRRSRWGGCVWIERDTAASGRRADTGGMVAVECLRVMWVKGLAGSPLVCGVVGHQRVSRRKVQPLPG